MRERILGDALFANRLQKQMIRNGMTQKELARRLEVTQSYVSKLIAGKSDPTLSTLRKLAIIFDRPIGRLVR